MSHLGKHESSRQMYEFLRRNRDVVEANMSHLGKHESFRQT